MTAGQLPLLEVAMAKMECNPVWSLLSGGGRGESVFSVSVYPFLLLVVRCDMSVLRVSVPGGKLFAVTDNGVRRLQAFPVNGLKHACHLHLDWAWTACTKQPTCVYMQVLLACCVKTGKFPHAHVIVWLNLILYL